MVAPVSALRAPQVNASAGGLQVQRQVHGKMPDSKEGEHVPEPDVWEFEKDLGIRPGFFQKLLNEGDDWSFVIKIHALLEAAVSHLLAEVVGKPELVDLFAQLELSNARTGKIAFAKVLNCLDDDERGMVRKLSELRNQLVHDLSNVDFDFSVWVKSLDPNQLKQYSKAFSPSGDTIQVVGNEVPFSEFFKQQPRTCIWVACLFLLALVYQRKDLARTRRGLETSQQEFAQQVLSGELFRSPETT